jgi:hypothetical protein
MDEESDCSTRPGAVRTYVVRDLVERIGDIARMDMADRLALRRDGRLRELIPVSYRGVVEGALQLAERYAAERNLERRTLRVVERSSPPEKPAAKPVR